MSLSLNDFAHDLRNRIRIHAGNDESESFLTDAFTRIMLDFLAEAGEINDAEVCTYLPRGMRVNGYELNTDEDSVDLFVAVHMDKAVPERIDKSHIDTAFRQVTAFFTKCTEGFYRKIEESLPVFGLAQAIHAMASTDGGFSRVRFFLITDGIARADRLPDIPAFGNAEVSLHVWDLERLYRWYTSGRDREEIVVEFGDDGIACLELDEANADYVSYLAAVPASILVSIYGQYGPRLLERNVRSFLQVKGGINKGIRQTILDEPGRFFAYNNGLTATASTVDITRDQGAVRLTSARDLQIVNGGQTTASLFRAARKDKAETDGLFVSMKLSVVRDFTDIDEFVSHIAKFANSQNKVNAADLSANDSFHRRLEELSRTEWAPARGSSNRESKWFYERARAQYADELARCQTPVKKKGFEAEYPRKQQFDKTDLAKYEQAWDQLPHLVSRGAQKNFVSFTERLERRGKIVPDLAYFHALVGRKILWDRTDEIVRKAGYDGYKINIVAYSISLLSHATARRLDFEKIWSLQALPGPLEEFVRMLAALVQPLVAASPSGNITDWQKSEKCWHAVLGKTVSVPSGVQRYLLAEGAVQAPTIETPDVGEVAEIFAAGAIEDTTWFAVASWAKRTKSLAPWQRSLAVSLGRIASNGKDPSIKQARQGMLLLSEARRLGFSAQDEQHQV